MIASYAVLAALYVIAIWTPLQYLFTRQFTVLPLYAVWLDDAVLAILSVCAGFAALRNPKKARLPLNLPLLLFLGVAVCSAIRNHATAIEFVLGLRALLQGVALYYVIVLLGVARRDLVRLGMVTVGLAVLQAPFACYQLATTYKLMSRDEVFGTMWRGASNSMAYFLVLVMLPLTGYWLREPSRRWPAAALGAMLVPIVFSSSRGSYYLAPVVFVVSFWEQLRRGGKARAVLAGGLALSAALFAIFYTLKSQNPDSEAFGELLPGRVVREQFGTENMGRLHFLGYLGDLFEREGVSTWWVGVGPARFSSTSGAYLGAPLLAEATRGAHSRIIPSQLIATVGEFGLLGFAAVAWAVWRGIGVLREAGKEMEEPGWRGWAEGAAGAGLFFLLAVPLENIWELPFCAYYFWGAVGAATAARRSIL